MSAVCVFFVASFLPCQESCLSLFLPFWLVSFCLTVSERPGAVACLFVLGQAGWADPAALPLPPLSPAGWAASGAAYRAPRPALQCCCLASAPPGAPMSASQLLSTAWRMHRRQPPPSAACLRCCLWVRSPGCEMEVGCTGLHASAALAGGRVWSAVAVCCCLSAGVCLECSLPAFPTPCCRAVRRRPAGPRTGIPQRAAGLPLRAGGRCGSHRAPQVVLARGQRDSGGGACCSAHLAALFYLTWQLCFTHNGVEWCAGW